MAATLTNLAVAVNVYCWLAVHTDSFTSTFIFRLLDMPVGAILRLDFPYP